MHLSPYGPGGPGGARRPRSPEHPRHLSVQVPACRSGWLLGRYPCPGVITQAERPVAPSREEADCPAPSRRRACCGCRPAGLDRPWKSQDRGHGAWGGRLLCWVNTRSHASWAVAPKPCGSESLNKAPTCSIQTRRLGIRKARPRGTAVDGEGMRALAGAGVSQPFLAFACGYRRPAASLPAAWRRLCLRTSATAGRKGRGPGPRGPGAGRTLTAGLKDRQEGAPFCLR